LFLKAPSVSGHKLSCADRRQIAQKQERRPKNTRGKSTMKNRIVFRALIVATGFGLLFAGLGTVGLRARGRCKCRIHPADSVGADDSQTQARPSLTRASTRMDIPFHRFHCYTRPTFTRRTGWMRCTPRARPGNGQTIVIVDAYGSPTVQGDLDRFSDTFQSAPHDVEVIHPTEHPRSTTA